MEEAVWDRTLNVNLRGPMFAAKYAIPHMVERGSGVIINTSSLAGTLSEGQRVAYSVSKAGLNALTRHIATRHGKQGIRCVSIALGLTKAPAVTELVPPEMLKGMHSTPPTLASQKILLMWWLFLLPMKLVLLPALLFLSTAGREAELRWQGW